MFVWGLYKKNEYKVFCKVGEKRIVNVSFENIFGKVLVVGMGWWYWGVDSRLERRVGEVEKEK